MVDSYFQQKSRSMKCYLCGESNFIQRKGCVRDKPELRVLECVSCSLVQLDSFAHIHEGFYADSGMHGDLIVPINDWLKSTEFDDSRRFQMLRPLISNRRLLDFGCGAGGFLNMAHASAKTLKGIELEKRVQQHWSGRIEVVDDVEHAGTGWDLVTAFHVIEHLADPITMLSKLGSLLSEGGRMIVEVPNSDDALISLYENDEFRSFTYWSQHLFLFNAETLRQVVQKAGLRVVAIQQHQRYPLSNHLHWLSRGAPGGHHAWSFLDSDELTTAYAKALAACGRCDTLVAYLERDQ